MEPLVRVLGLHQAFSSVVFYVGVVALGLSTAVCAWQRTKAAATRARVLREGQLATAETVSAGRADLQVDCDPSLAAQDVLARTSEVLSSLGIKTKRKGDLLSAVSPSWSVWGSAVFHWGLVALVVALIVGNLLRSEGLMGIAVGETKADAADSYGVLHAGPLHNWGRVQRGIRVDAFDPDYKTGGIDRGPTPTVSVLDASGHVIQTQRVYPNMTLKTGALTIYPNDWGFSADMELSDPSGKLLGRQVQLVDFSANTSSGTLPLGSVGVAGANPSQALNVSAAVIMERSGNAFVKRMPKQPQVVLTVTTANGATLGSRVANVGQPLQLPNGDIIRAASVGYYARLSVVDDWTIPFLYIGFIIAGIGLTITVALRQEMVLATVTGGDDGPRLVGTVRLWRNSSTSRSEIEAELRRALGSPTPETSAQTPAEDAEDAG